MQKKSSLVMLLLCTTTASAAQAYEDGPCCRAIPRWYGGMTGAAVYMDDTRIKHPNFSLIGEKGDKFSIGYGMRGQIGYNVTQSLRTEVELGYNTNDVKNPSIPVTNGKHVPQREVTLMANGYYDFVNRSNYTPYIGVGAGMIEIKTRHIYTSTFGPIASTGKLQSWAPGYQLMTGISHRFAMGSKPLDIYIGYRYQASKDAKVKDNPAFPGPITIPYSSQAVDIGVRFYFN